MADLPAFIPGHWDTMEGYSMALEYAGKQRCELFAQNETDMAVANRVFMDPSIMNLTVAKSRIRWLSVQLALANQELPVLRAQDILLREAIEASSKILQAGGTHAHLLRLGSSILVDGPPAMAKRIDDLTTLNTELLTALKEINREEVISPYGQAVLSAAISKAGEK